jgi:hypothetical protein
MADLRNSKNSPHSKKNSLYHGRGCALCFGASSAVMAVAISWFQKTGATLYYGDAEAHLDIARRIVDSRTPGWHEIGTTWLPLPHLLMIPLVRNDWMWITGLAGAIPSGICMAVAATFLFATIGRLFASTLAGGIAAAVFLLNPNILYLGSVPMTESVFFASLFGLLYFTIRFLETQGWGALTGAALAAFAGTLARYEAWFLLPFVALYIAISTPGKRWLAPALFCAIAGAGPLLWLAHNRWYYGDPLYFYRGPYSAIAIQGTTGYPGRGDWRAATLYFFSAGRLVAGLPAIATGAAGLALAMARNAIWPVILLVLPLFFYVWSIHSSGTPVFVPTLPPYTFYNTRYAVAFLPPIALGLAALARFGKLAAGAVAAVALGPFVVQLVAQSSGNAITWQESDVNSRVRRQSIAEAAEFLRHAGPHETYLTSFGELTPIFRILDIPLRDTLTGDNDTEWVATAARPDLFLHEDWAVVKSGDEAQAVIQKARLDGPRYKLSRRIEIKGAPVIEIYHRIYENPVH